MDKESKFNEEMLALYKVVGKATGYWANYYLRSVRNLGGVAHAKKALAQKGNAQDGFKKLIEVGRPDLSIEATVLKEEYKALFSSEELREAQKRIDSVPSYAWRQSVDVEENFAGEIAEAYKRIAFEEAEHAAKFAELLGEVVTSSTKKNLQMRVDAERGACKGKKELATLAKKLNYDAIHDTVHEMCKDEARHGQAFEGLLKRYF